MTIRTLVFSTCLFLIQNSFANSFNAMMISEKDNSIYREAIQKVTAGYNLSLNNQDIKEVQSITDQTFNDWSKSCNDSDTFDTIETKFVNQNQIFSFTCISLSAEGKEQLDGFIFEIDPNGVMVGLLHLSPEMKDYRESKINKMNIMIKTAMATATSYYLSEFSSNTLFKKQFNFDKNKHAKYSSILGSTLTLFGKYILKLDSKKAALFGFTSCLVIGALKEIKDKKDPKHNADIKDFLADGIGCSLSSGLIYFSTKF